MVLYQGTAAKAMLQTAQISLDFSFFILQNNSSTVSVGGRDTMEHLRTVIRTHEDTVCAVLQLFICFSAVILALKSDCAARKRAYKKDAGKA